MWIKKSPKEVAQELKTSLDNGLTQEIYQQRLQEFGLNKLPEEKKHHFMIIFLKNFIEPLVLLLLVVAIISAVIGEYKEMGVILGIVIINAGIGTFQEVKSRKSLDALKKLASPKVFVKRDGKVVEVEVSSLVPGDLVLLDAGKFIPADLRIVEVGQVQIDESALTGESVPVVKNPNALSTEVSSLGDQTNMAFMSTFITKGRLSGVVTGTGSNTEIGKIAAMLNDVKATRTPLQKKLAKLVHLLSAFAILVAIVILLWNIFYLKDGVSNSLMSAIAMAVAVVPESLLLIVSMILAIGTSRMAHRHAIIKKLPVVEVLGAVNVICSDKTGTITQNRITVTKYLLDGKLGEAKNFVKNPETQHFTNALALCSDAFVGADNQRVGDPTELALVDFINNIQLSNSDIIKSYPRVAELPFDSDRKLMSTVHNHQSQKLVYTKGALDALINRCSKILIDGKIESLSKYKEKIISLAESMSNQSLRVLAFAFKEIEDIATLADDLESNLVFIGCVGMIDPIRPEVITAVRSASEAGIRTVMITGDHRTTATAIARELGIVQNDDQVVSGEDLDAMDESTLVTKINYLRVFSRVSPKHKVRIVNCLRAQGLVVAMTGDGVNDGPSLSAAHVGIAMGITGTDVAKEASGMILTDDNFSTIVTAVEEGRNVYQKIKKSVALILSTNLSEVIAFIVVLMATQIQMLIPIQILWVNLVVESIIAIPLGMDINDASLMKARPRPQGESLLKNITTRTIISTFVIAGSVLAAFFIGQSHSAGQGQTMAFFVMASAPMFAALSLRVTEFVFGKKAMFGNKKLLIAIGVGFALNIFLVFTPPVANFIGLEKLTGAMAGEAIALIIAPFVILEASKQTIQILKKLKKSIFH